MSGDLGKKRKYRRVSGCQCRIMIASVLAGAWLLSTLRQRPLDTTLPPGVNSGVWVAQDALPRDLDVPELREGASVSQADCSRLAVSLGMRAGVLEEKRAGEGRGRCQLLPMKYPYKLSRARKDGFRMVLLKNESAKCLDGTPGGFLIKQGDPRKWMVHLQGGGWCVSEADCLERSGQGVPCPADADMWGSETSMGSSRCWPRMGLPPMDGGGGPTQPFTTTQRSG